MPTCATYRLPLSDFTLTTLREIINPKLMSLYDEVPEYKNFGDIKVYLFNGKGYSKDKLETAPQGDFLIQHVNVDHFSVVMFINEEKPGMFNGRFNGGFCCRTFQNYLYFDDLDTWNDDDYMGRRFYRYMMNENNIAYLGWKRDKATPLKMKRRTSQDWGWSIDQVK